MEILTSQAIAKQLKITERRVRQLAVELALEPQRIGNALIFTKSDLTKMAKRPTRNKKSNNATA